MVFSSLTFIYLFLPIFLGLYYLVPKRGKNFVLLVGSVLFYAWGEPFYVVLLLNLAVANFIFGHLLCHFKQDRRLKIAFLIIALAVNLGVLVSCKFSPDIFTLFNKVSSVNIQFPTIMLPIGLSFYILSCISYIVDIYIGKSVCQKNFINYMVYIAMFPKLLCGPIALYRDIESQLVTRTVNWNNISDGIGLFIKGLGKKILLADNLNGLSTAVFATSIDSLPVATAWLGIISSLFQFYFDLSGYTDMARGLGKMLGFDLPKNFNSPFVSKSVSEFCSRWNISLLNWSKTYIYVPLGGNKMGILRTTFNVFAVCFMISIWHGVNNNFQFLAVFYCAIVMAEKLFLQKRLEKIPDFFGRCYTIFLTLIAFVLLMQKDIMSALSYLGSMFGMNGQPFYDNTTLFYLSTYLMILILCTLSSNDFLKRKIQKTQKFYPNASAYLTPVCEIAVMVVSTAFMVNSPGTTFIYFGI